MTDFFTRLVQRTISTGPRLEPLISPIFSRPADTFGDAAPPYKYSNLDLNNIEGNPVPEKSEKWRQAVRQKPVPDVPGNLHETIEINGSQLPETDRSAPEKGRESFSEEKAGGDKNSAELVKSLLRPITRKEEKKEKSISFAAGKEETPESKIQLVGKMEPPSHPSIADVQRTISAGPRLEPLISPIFSRPADTFGDAAPPYKYSNLDLNNIEGNPVPEESEKRRQAVRQKPVPDVPGNLHETIEINGSQLPEADRSASEKGRESFSEEKAGGDKNSAELVKSLLKPITGKKETPDSKIQLVKKMEPPSHPSIADGSGTFLTEKQAAQNGVLISNVQKPGNVWHGYISGKIPESKYAKCESHEKAVRPGRETTAPEQAAITAKPRGLSGDSFIVEKGNQVGKNVQVNTAKWPKPLVALPLQQAFERFTSWGAHDINSRRRSIPERPAAPTVSISIGRVEVRAAAEKPTPPPLSPKRAATRITLEEYLRQKSEGWG